MLRRHLGQASSTAVRSRAGFAQACRVPPLPFPGPASAHRQAPAVTAPGVAGGEWYSHPIEGECLNGHHVGDGSGCSWEVLARNKVINATCMYKRLDANVEAYESACFKACPQPTNVTSTCYLR